jgi:hypothetical protein
MPYILREDGERFVIPSYRDVLLIKQKVQLKKEIFSLSDKYGEFITLQKKGTMQYEVAFSPETGYLLGESIWHHFRKPLDLIYCEAIPNTTEAILVIVKSGSVYLDGQFPLDSIPEELIIFLTQQNNFEIYLYGDVPISKEPEAGKISFETGSVKSFTVLDKPVFPNLQLYRMYQLQLVDAVLKAQGIGVFPIKQLLTILVLLGLGYWGYQTLFTYKEKKIAEKKADPYEFFRKSLVSPTPEEVIASITKKFDVLLTMPGWGVNEVAYSGNSISVKVVSRGGTVSALYAWAARNDATVNIERTGIVLSMPITVNNRPKSDTIMNLDQVIAALIDRLAKVYPGNHMTMMDETKKGVFSQVQLNIQFSQISPAVLNLISEQLTGLPLILRSMTLGISNSTLTGTLTLDALGN